MVFRYSQGAVLPEVGDRRVLLEAPNGHNFDLLVRPSASEGSNNFVLLSDFFPSWEEFVQNAESENLLGVQLLRVLIEAIGPVPEELAHHEGLHLLLAHIELLLLDHPCFHRVDGGCQDLEAIAMTCNSCLLLVQDVLLQSDEHIFLRVKLVFLLLNVKGLADVFTVGNSDLRVV